MFGVLTKIPRSYSLLKFQCIARHTLSMTVSNLLYKYNGRSLVMEPEPYMRIVFFNDTSRCTCDVLRYSFSVTMLNLPRWRIWLLVRRARTSQNIVLVDNTTRSTCDVLGQGQHQSNLFRFHNTELIQSVSIEAPPTTATTATVTATTISQNALLLIVHCYQRFQEDLILFCILHHFK